MSNQNFAQATLQACCVDEGGSSSARYLTWCAALPHDVKDGKTSNNGATSRPFEAIEYPVQPKWLGGQNLF